MRMIISKSFRTKLIMSMKIRITIRLRISTWVIVNRRHVGVVTSVLLETVGLAFCVVGRGLRVRGGT